MADGNGNSDRAAMTAVDQEAPDVFSEQVPEAANPWAMAEVDPERELAKFEAASALLAKLVPASIKATRPQDWVQMGKKAYLQGTGIDRVAPLWGLVFGEPRVTRYDHDDGHFEFVVVGGAGSRRTGMAYKSITGGRSSRDSFFWPKTDGESKITKGDYKGQIFDPKKHIDSLDVRKAAVENWKTRSAAMLTGLRGLTEEDLKSAGIDTTKITRVEYSRGGQGGATVSSDVKAEQVKLGNAVLAKAGGDIEVAKKMMLHITKGDKPGKDGKVFPGFDTASRLTLNWQFSAAWTKLTAIPDPEPQAGEEQAT